MYIYPGHLRSGILNAPHYLIDYNNEKKNSFLKTVSFSFSGNTGLKLENIVFLHLLQSKKGYKLFYHSSEKSDKECDFLIMKDTFIVSAIRVSSEFRKQ
ncbi:MAG: DUF4143 domain-containing protein [Methanomicrobiaceae archaeon]|nr:DUF4143 domain-containing protein [Methanomicrobiaceae archaeon]